MYYYSYYVSPVGELTIACRENSIVGLWIARQRYYMNILTGQEYREKETETIQRAKNWLERYFHKEKTAIGELPLEYIGSDFQILVWKILTEIPYGQVITYGDLAKEIARRKGVRTMSAQAAGGAVGRNPISIIVPCHRVVGANGSLTGYSGGVSAKRKLLEWEGADMSKLFVPANRIFHN